MSFTVETKSSVSASGILPEGIEASYRCTYQKGDIRQGDTATLRLSGMAGIRVEAVRLYLRSNKSGGAGIITVMADTRRLYRAEGTYLDWFGAYNNADYQAIGWTGSEVLDEGVLSVQVVGTANSLHIQRYEVVYTLPAPQAYQVTLITCDRPELLTEAAPDSGIVLPEREDRGTWYFAGWTTDDIPQAIDEQTDILRAGTRYFPKKNTTLWAVWTDLPYPDWQRRVRPESGYYVLAFGSYLLTGFVEGGLLDLVDDDYVYTSDIYYLAFDTVQQTCTIRNYESDRYIGYTASATALNGQASPWHYRVLADSTWLFSAREEADKVWVLYQKPMEPVAWLRDYVLGDNPNSAWSLYALPDPTQTRHWSARIWPLGLPSAECGSSPQKLLIDGHVVLRIGGHFYTPTGRLIR